MTASESAAPSADPGPMTLPEHLRALGRPAAMSVLLAVSTVVMCAYWYLGSPGAQLAVDATRDYATALQLCLLAFGLWVIVPTIAMLAVKFPISKIGLGLGDVRFNLKVTGIAIVLVTVPMAMGTKDPAIQAVYPWPGADAGTSLGAWVQWLATYLIYYIAFEFFFRGVLIRAVEKEWGLTNAIWFAAICATLVHVGKPWSETLAAFPVSLLFGVQAVRGRSIWWPILIHWWVGSVTDTSSLYWQDLLNF